MLAVVTFVADASTASTNLIDIDYWTVKNDLMIYNYSSLGNSKCRDMWGYELVVKVASLDDKSSSYLLEVEYDAQNLMPPIWRVCSSTLLYEMLREHCGFQKVV